MYSTLSFVVNVLNCRCAFPYTKTQIMSECNDYFWLLIPSFLMLGKSLGSYSLGLQYSGRKYGQTLPRTQKLVNRGSCWIKWVDWCFCCIIILKIYQILNRPTCESINCIFSSNEIGWRNGHFSHITVNIC